MAADVLSRNCNLQLEWNITDFVFEKIVSNFSLPNIDLFASRITAQLPNYVTCKQANNAGCIKKLEDFKMSGKLSFYQNISKRYVRLSISASTGLSNSKNDQKNELRKAKERFLKASF